MHACTIAPRNHLAQVRVLAESFRVFHPMSRFTVLVVDGEPGDRHHAQAPYEVLLPGDAGLGVDELLRLALIHDADELRTVMTPVLLAHLLDNTDVDVDVIVYLDPDSILCASIGDVEPMARQHGIVFLPQVLRPPPSAVSPTIVFTDQLSLLDDVGFIAVGPGARPFLRWWRRRMAADRDLNPTRPIGTVSKWFELVPGPFEHAVWRDPGVGVAYWNLHERPLSRLPDGPLLAGGVPLRWMRFNGYDVDRPYLLSPQQCSTPTSLLSHEPALAALTVDYRDRLLAADVEHWRTVPYRYGSIAGGPIPFSVRRLAASALSGLSILDPPPLPFGPDGAEGFVRWLNQPWARRGDHLITLLLFRVWETRPDLQAHFPDPLAADIASLVMWSETAVDYAETFGHLHDPAVAQPAKTTTAGPEPEPLPGLNIIGYLRAELGLGEAGRRMALAADAGGLPHETVAYGLIAARQLDPFAAHATIADSVAPYRVNVLCVNADGTVHLAANLPPALRRNRYNVGLWFWETNRPQPGTDRALGLVDEIWVTSEYLAEVLRPITDKPVLVTPLAVPRPAPTHLDRRDLRLPADRRIFLCVYDANSTAARKNPMGALTAYRRAFGPDDGAHLVLKSINGALRPELLEQLWWAARGRPDIELRDGHVSRSEMNALMLLSDVYVSLHRSEGFGLNLAAAMAAGKPVIATGYSGNLAFMHGENSRLVPYGMTEVGPGQAPYPPDDWWAEPDLDVAAGHMASLLADPDAARALGARAREDIARTHGPAVAGGWLAHRFDQILNWSPALV